MPWNDRNLRHLPKLRHELIGLRTRLMDEPELSEAWRRKARLSIELAKLAAEAACCPPDRDGEPQAPAVGHAVAGL